MWINENNLACCELCYNEVKKSCPTAAIGSICFAVLLKIEIKNTITEFVECQE